MPAFWFTRFPRRKSSLSGDARTASIKPGSKNTVCRTYLPPRADAAELRVAVAAVLAVAADAVHVHDLARRRSLEARSTRQIKGGEKRGNVRNSVW